MHPHPCHLATRMMRLPAMPPPHGGAAAPSTAAFLLSASMGGGATSVVGCSWRLGAAARAGPAAGAVWIGARQALRSRRSAAVGGPALPGVATVGWGGGRAALPWAVAWRVGRAGCHGEEVAPVAGVPAHVLPRAVLMRLMKA